MFAQILRILWLRNVPVAKIAIVQATVDVKGLEVKTLRKHIKIESSRKFNYTMFLPHFGKLKKHIIEKYVSTFLLENVDFIQLS